MSATPELFAALAKAQGEFPAIERSKTVVVKTKTGGTYSFSYAPLDVIFSAVRPALAKNGLSISQPLGMTDAGMPALVTIIAHASGGFLHGILPLPMPANETPQEFGSKITYLRRYGLVSALGIATEDDDDGNHASGHTAATKKGAESQAPRAKAPPPAPAEDVDFAPELPTMEDPDLRTDKQNKMIGALVGKLVEVGILSSVDEVRAYMDANFGKTSRASLTRSEASALIDWLKEKEGELL